MTFSKTSTIFTAVLAYFFLKEQIGIKGWIGVFIGFIGILFITEFDGSYKEYIEDKRLREIPGTLIGQKREEGVTKEILKEAKKNIDQVFQEEKSI